MATFTPGQVLTAAELNSQIVPTAWTNATYNTGWTSFGGSFGVAQYRKLGDVVYLRGLVKRTSGSATTIFTLPAEFRPSHEEAFPACNSNAFAEIAISATGPVIIAAGGVTSLSLSGIQFSTL